MHGAEWVGPQDHKGYRDPQARTDGAVGPQGPQGLQGPAGGVMAHGPLQGPEARR